MKIFNHVSTVLLGLFALSHAIPAPVAVESMAIEQRGIDVESEAGAKVAENILQDTFQKMKAIDKKYSQYPQFLHIPIPSPPW
ncbi:hypothetical protein BZA77DRAFT_320780 [Pyronema omphalodes]|nr:hypothetical protein BZA77DRAFT_320780 [Pyronema omphalodes]